MAATKLSVIVVSYFVREEVRECLRCLRATGLDLEVFVVDNGSTDGTREMLRDEFGDWSALRPMLRDDNVGLAAANNIPLPLVEGEYVLILNPDTLPTAAALGALIRHLDRSPDVGVVGPRQLYEDGTPHSSFHRHRWGIGHMVLFTLVPRSALRHWYDHPRRLRDGDAGYVSGACLLIRADLFRRIGGYDEAYFLCAEDTADLCRRVKAEGFRVRYVTDAEIVHYGARSYSHAKPFSLLKTCEGRLHYARKWGGRRGHAIVLGTLALNSAAKFAAYRLLAAFDAARYGPPAAAHRYVLRNLRAPAPGRRGAPVVAASG